MAFNEQLEFRELNDEELRATENDQRVIMAGRAIARAKDKLS